ncbi:MAG: 30S ribosomal protein S3 [Chloroflexi bacterium]|nr:30S ribosomal protein S3 [Chloroflexota bacterium]
MGRKVNPIGYRLGIIKDWDSKWFAEGEDYAANLRQDYQIRELVHNFLGRASISRIFIERYPTRLSVKIMTAKPGVVIGRRGSTINALKAELEKLTGITGNKLRVDVEEVRQPDLDANIVAESVAEQLERRVSQRRAMRRAMQQAMRGGAEGIRIMCKGRLSGSEMGRTDWVREGRVPLHTLRADIDYGTAEASTTFGKIGVKVWVYRGEVLPGMEQAEGEAATTAR